MKTNQIIALTIGIIGLIGMFFFPEPETNFLYYLGFILVIIILITISLTWKKIIKATK